MRVLPIVTHGSDCPRCGSHTYRVRMPLLLRPIRHAMRTLQRRACISRACEWHGFALPVHAPQGSDALSSAG